MINRKLDESALRPTNQTSLSAYYVRYVKFFAWAYNFITSVQSHKINELPLLHFQSKRHTQCVPYIHLVIHVLPQKFIFNCIYHKLDNIHFYVSELNQK